MPKDINAVEAAIPTKPLVPSIIFIPFITDVKRNIRTTYFSHGSFIRLYSNGVSINGKVMFEYEKNIVQDNRVKINLRNGRTL